jgi:hypothetical protein
LQKAKPQDVGRTVFPRNVLSQRSSTFFENAALQGAVALMDCTTLASRLSHQRRYWNGWMVKEQPRTLGQRAKRGYTQTRCHQNAPSATPGQWDLSSVPSAEP